MDLQEKILNCKTMNELDVLRLEVVKDKESFLINQQLFIAQKNKIKRHGGAIK